ncbi:MAG: NAD-dependent deacetylase [Desulfuromonadaceae bacterium]|nr:NAD-dependent deacetylase [Desulfuromonadaceae bacterium]MDD2855745.1 NAD-dependent deacetylase [Desulfuromonadaceae bacterium]
MKRSAQIISEAEVFIITAGAGMGVDSGLPDFRGNEGFWEAYPPYAKLGVSFIGMANPDNFETDPAFAWGFYGHRTNLYRDTVPHKGFHILKNWIESKNADYFVVTSNVDGQFQKAGFDEERILEVHGSIHWLQCLKPCSNEIWGNFEAYHVDSNSMRVDRIPVCPNCDEISRPNILMFGDCSWISDRKDYQQLRYRQFRQANIGKRIVVIELGAGKAIPTIRYISEQLGMEDKVSVIRINPRESEIKQPHISIGSASLEALMYIDSLL